MSTSSVPESSSVPDPNAASSLPALSQQVIPGTTVIGTGATGDVWSYTIPPITSVIIPSASATLPPSSSPEPTSTEASGTFVATEIVISGTTVVGGTETGVPWSYTIPAQSLVSSIFVPIPTATSEPLSLTSSLTPTHPSPSIPGYTEPVPRPPPDASHTTLSGGVVAAILMGLFLLIFAIAGCIWLRGRGERDGAGGDWERAKAEKDIGVVWGRGWGSEGKGVATWRKRQGMNHQESDGYIRSGGSEVMAPASALLGPTARFRQDHSVDPTPANGSAELLIERPGRDRGSSSFSPNTRFHTTTINTHLAYPVAARYPQTHGPDIDTRTSSLRNVNMNINDDTNNKQPTKSKRPIPAPSPHVYAPPPEDTPEPSLKVPHPTNPFSTRPTSPYRAASPYGSQTTSSSHGRKVLSKREQRVVPPSSSAFMRHMLPSRTLSLRRPKAPPATPSSPTTDPVPTRPGLNSLPSFIRDRRFSPGPARNDSRSTAPDSGESVIFSPSPKPGQLPSHAPSRVSSPLARTSALAQPRLPSARDRYLAPPSYGNGRDRSSQLTSTTRSGGTSRSRDTRSTGRSGESRLTGRSGRGGGLAQIPESDREPGAGRRHEPRRRQDA
ncbi:unnamed protein product [Rhizoctonia solani]|uniref:Uncharacterized protein n=1 Tax=Rhizoctonia solani TaxID=456999 RepID=A0A8H3C569_9AGAM|nr:unnamed protein product [Rhizoctonia solani]